jgi:4-hydroxybenzoate polyprenyltransferase
MSVEAGVGVMDVAVRRRGAAAAFAAVRPHQWTKNLLVFAGILFAAKLEDPTRWLEAITCFVAYCAASSAAYLVNDIRDRDADRAHPVKRYRPIASGELGTRTASWLAALLFGSALGLAALLGLRSLGLVVLFVVMQLAYTHGLKHIVLVDVLVIAGLFVIRAAAGAVAVAVPISPWLLLCTGLLALFLALGKRRAEIVLVEKNGTPGRKVLDGYTLPVIDQLVSIVAAAAIVAYALYTFNVGESRTLMITIPFVVYAIFRYLMLLQRRVAGEEPDRVLATDVPILAAVAGWAVTCAVVLLIEY